jgi:hypothetical protein
MLLQRLKVWIGGAGIGACIALAGAIALGPRVVAWRWEPPEQQALSCAPQVNAALGMLVTIQVWTALGGALLGVVLAVLLSRRTKSPAP